MTLREFLDKWKINKYSSMPIWENKALEDCYKFVQIMTDDWSLIVDYQGDEFCLVSYDDYLQSYITKDDAIFLINKFDFKATERAKEEIEKNRI